MGWFDDKPGDLAKKAAKEAEALKKKADKTKLPKKGSRKRVSAKGKTARWILSEIKAGRTVTGYESWCAENIGDEQIKNVPIKAIERHQKKLGALEAEGTFVNTRRNSIRDTAAELRSGRNPGGRKPPSGAFGGPRNEDGTPRSTWW